MPPAPNQTALRRSLGYGVALCLLLLGAAAHADPGYYLLMPYSEPGQLALDLRYWSVKSSAQTAVLWPEAGLRYGVNSRWTTQLLTSYIGDTLNNQRLSAVSWHNTLLLTQGQYPFDLAVHAQLIHNPGERNALEFGPLWQTEIGRTHLNANLVFERNAARAGALQLKYQGQVLHRLQPGLRAGVQAFGELGQWNHWSDRQSHRAGPVLNLVLPGKLELRAAYLWGKTYGSRGDMLSAQLLLPF